MQFCQPTRCRETPINDVKRSLNQIQIEVRNQRFQLVGSINRNAYLFNFMLIPESGQGTIQLVALRAEKLLWTVQQQPIKSCDAQSLERTNYLLLDPCGDVRAVCWYGR